MTEEEKKNQGTVATTQPTVQAQTQQTTQETTAPAAPMSYGGSYDTQINDLYKSITNRQPFSYDVNGDALYQQYKDMYVNDAKRSMKDTMGQGAMLTGGYGNSYGSVAGQQMYDQKMERLTSMIPELQQNAYGMYQDQGKGLETQYSMLTDLAANEQNTLRTNYNQLSNLILSTGYNPTEDELKNAGMNADQVTSMRQKWIASNPQAAYAQGAITPDEYYKLTGAWPAGYTPPSYGGGGYGYGGPGDDGKATIDATTVNSMISKGYSVNDVQQWVLDQGGNRADVAKTAQYAAEMADRKNFVSKYI